MQKKLGLLVILVVGFLLLSPQQSQAEDVSFYAKQEVEKGWETFNGGDPGAALRSFHQATIIDPKYAPAYILAAARENWNEALQMGEKYGFFKWATINKLCY